MSVRSSETWFKCYRSEEARTLAATPSAFMLLWQITCRAQRTSSYNKHNLDVGEAFLGDYKSLGMTQGQYRQAKKLLQKCGFAKFKGTNKGTIATLIDTTIFDPNLENHDEQPNKPTENRREKSNEQATTTKNVKNEKNENNTDKVNLGSNGNERVWHLKERLKAIDEERESIMARCTEQPHRGWVTRDEADRTKLIELKKLKQETRDKLAGL